MTSRDRLLRGTAVSPGIALGTAYVMSCADGTPVPVREIDAAEVESELERFEAAVERAERELLELGETVARKLSRSEAAIFSAHALLVRDATLHRRVGALVRDEHMNVEAAVSEAIVEFTRVFDERPGGDHLERGADIRDVGRRVLSALLDEPEGSYGGIPEGAILVTDELLPSTTARLDVGRARAFVTERGGRFAHAAILARSSGTPAVMAIPGATMRIRTGDRLVVDGIAGGVLVNPGPAIERDYERVEAEIRGAREALRELIDVPAVTLDGERIVLMANIARFADTEAAALYGAAGIGLYRTEFAFTAASRLPGEDEQHAILTRAAERMRPHRVVVRMLDIGGDKQLDYYPLPAARNPSLALRGIRLLFDRPDIARPQIRAFLRAGADHDIAILIPVVGGIEEVRRSRELIRGIAAELAAEGVACDPDPPVGAMIEVPSAALMAASIAREVDFLSLGTNDLVQYVLAADREDQGSAPYYQPLHPAVLRLMDHVIRAAAEAHRPLTICGEIAGDPALTELLVGMGLREFSVAPGNLLPVKQAIRAVHTDDAAALARAAVASHSVAEIEALVAGRF